MPPGRAAPAGAAGSPPGAAWHTAGPNGWRLGSTATYGEGQVCQPPEDDDGVLRAGQNPAGDHFTATEGTTLTVQVVVQGPGSGTGQLRGWVDWNDDGTFTQVYNQTLSAADTYTVELEVPPHSCQYDPLAMRWRVGDSGGDPTAGWSGGEVEDYVLEIAPVPPVVLDAAPHGSGVPLEVVPAVVTMSEEVLYPSHVPNCEFARLERADGWLVPGEVGIVGSAVYFTPVVPLVESTWYTATVADFVDGCEVSMESYAWTFRTEDIPPEVLTTAPLQVASGLPL